MAKEGNITITNMVYGLGAAIVIVGRSPAHAGLGNGCTIKQRGQTNAPL